MTLLEYQNKKTFLQKAIFQIDLKKFLWLKELKKLWRWHVIAELKGEEIVGTFHEKILQKKKKIQKKFRLVKVIKRKDDKLYIKSKSYDSSFNSLIDKKDII